MQGAAVDTLAARATKPVTASQPLPRLEPTIRYLAFYQTLGDSADGARTWPAVSTGLLVLRLVDACLDGDRDAALGAPTVLAAARAIESTDPIRAHLIGLAEQLAGERAVTVELLAPGILSYSRALDAAGFWLLAADAALCVAGHARGGSRWALAVDAYLRHGRLLRMAARLDESRASYEHAGRIAREAGDLRGTLRAQLGVAALAADRGNVPQAERSVEAALRRARAAALDDVTAMALEQRAHIAHLRRDHERAVRATYQALELMTDSTHRARQLLNMAAAFGMLGARAAAREAMLVVLATSPDTNIRWTSLINLMELASLDGADSVFEQYRVELASEPLQPYQLAQFHLHVGQAYARAGRVDAADVALRAAVRVAEEYRFNRIRFAADETREALVREQGTREIVASATIPESLTDVVDALAAMQRRADLTARV